MKTWYSQYESQCWYKNTFLVNKPEQIARAVDENGREWNNVCESGCNFTCLAMIVGINPAYLASVAANTGMFRLDRQRRAQHPWRGRPSHGLVWDRNGPLRERPLKLKQIWHPMLRRKVNIVLELLDIKYVEQSAKDRVASASDTVKLARGRGLHVICGHADHSRLVAGVAANNFYLWDPDSDAVPIARSIDGQLSFEWFFNSYDKEAKGAYKSEKAEFWLYRAEVK